MPQPAFRLAAVLKLREALRDRQRVELAEAQNRAAEIRRRLDEVAQQLQGLVRQRRQDVQAGDLRVSGLVDAQRFQATLRARHAGLAAQHVAAQAEVESHRQAVVEADRQVRVLEKLRDKQREEHRRQESRRESKLLDEVAGRATIA
jgi:flagellar FliJ protein